MTRGRGDFSSRGGSSYRGSTWGNSNRGGYSPRNNSRNSRFPAPSSQSMFSHRPKYNEDRFGSGNRNHSDDYSNRKSYRDTGYGRDRSPLDRKRMRVEAASSRHDNYGGNQGGMGGGPANSGGYGGGFRYTSDYSDRRSFSNDRHSGGGGGSSRRDDFRRPSGGGGLGGGPSSGPSRPGRGGYRGGRGALGFRGGASSSRPPPVGKIMRERQMGAGAATLPPRRRLVESSYAVRKRLPPRVNDQARRLRITKMRRAIASKRLKSEKDELMDDNDDEDDEDLEEEEDEEEEEEEEEKSDQETKKDDSKEESGGDAKKEKPAEAGEEKTAAGKSPEEKSPSKRPPMIRLRCPHCGYRSTTFKRYEYHLSGAGHMSAMRKLAIKQRSTLVQMRKAQRTTQNELEKNSDDLQGKTNFCPICKLNYKQRKSIHQASESHKNMRKFLMPVCKLCTINFKSPMAYESHCCSIEHIKRKQRAAEANEGSEHEDLEEFTTIDSVGDEDADGDAKPEVASSKPEKSEEDEEEVNVGIEQVNKVEAYYCDLCKMYLPRAEDSEMPKILQRHCKLRVHMTRYVHFKDLQKRAERLQRKENNEKDAKKKKEEEASKVKEEEKVEEKKEEEKKKEEVEEVKDGEEEALEEKMWEDVDKELGDVIAEVDEDAGGKSSDEDEDVNGGERFDRFNSSEKNGDETVKEEKDEDVKAVEAKEEK